MAHRKNNNVTCWKLALRKITSLGPVIMCNALIYVVYLLRLEKVCKIGKNACLPMLFILLSWNQHEMYLYWSMCHVFLRQTTHLNSVLTMDLNSDWLCQPRVWLLVSRPTAKEQWHGQLTPFNLVALGNSDNKHTVNKQILIMVSFLLKLLYTSLYMVISMSQLK